MSVESVKRKTKVILEIEVETDENCDLEVEARAILEEILDEGILQDAIVSTGEIDVSVTSALVRGTETFEPCSVCGKVAHENWCTQGDT